MMEIMKRVKWKLLPLLVVFLITVGVLLGIYRAKDIRIAERLDHEGIFGSARKSTSRKLHRGLSRLHEDSFTYDRWVVASVDGDEPLACALVEASIDSGWKPILIGNASCCQKPPCVSLDEAKLQSSPFEIASFLTPDSRLVQRNVAYLHAIQHGARHIFDAYHSNYRRANISAQSLKKEMHRHLHNVTLAVSIGLVAERPYLKRVSNPYAHFGRPDMWAVGFKKTITRDNNNFMYHICEVRPPSIEKFLEVDDGYFDNAAPPLTLPGTTLSPFLSRNVLYSAEAFWGLPFLPGNSSLTDRLLLHHPHLARSLWNQALLGDIAGSVKLSLSTLPTLTNFKHSSSNDHHIFWEISSYTDFLLKWSCSTRSILKCTNDLAQDMVHRGYISQNDLAFLQAWANDLRKLRYLEPPIITRRRGALNPCIGADGLFGIAYHPALTPKPLSEEALYRRRIMHQKVIQEEDEYDYQKSLYLERLLKKSNESSSSDLKYDVINEKYAEESRYHDPHRYNPEKKKDDLIDELHVIKETTDSICPGYSSFISSDTPGCANILLVIAMTNPRYDLIPLLEVVYRQHFKNVLYCGPPHESLEIYKKKFQNQEGRTFSFLPSHTKYTYECLMGALEMGYRVDGYMLATDETLINHMEIKNMNLSRIWYGGDHVTKISGKDWRGVDPGANKLPRSIEGLHRVLAFLKKTVLGDAKTEVLPEYNQRYRRDILNEEVPSHESDSQPVKDVESQDVLDDLEIDNRAHLNPREDLPTADILKVLDDVRHEDVPAKEEPQWDLTEDHREQIKVALSARAQPLIASSDNRAVVEQLTYDAQEHEAPEAGEHKHEPQVLPEETPAQRVSELQGEPSSDVQTENELKDETNDFVPALESVPVHKDEANSVVKADFALENSKLETLVDVEKAASDGNIEDVPAGDSESDEDEGEPKNFAEVLRELLVASRTDDTVEITELPILPATMPEDPVAVNMSLSLINATTESVVEVSTEKNKELEMLKQNASEIFDRFEDEWEILSPPAAVATVNDADPAPLESVEVEEENVTIEHHWHHKGPVTSVEAEPVARHSENVSQPTNSSAATDPVVEHVKTAEPIDAVIDSSEHRPVMKPKEENEEQDTKIDELLGEIAKLYSVIEENIHANMPSSKSGNGPLGYVYGDMSSYRLDPQEFHHFQCDKSTNIEFCKVAADFLYSLSENIGNQFQLFYDKVPLFYIPNRHVLKFYLLSNLMLQNGITDEIAIPMILRGLGAEDKWVKLERVNLSFKTVIDPKSQLQPHKAAYLYPVDFQAVHSDTRYQKVFCLKFLNHVLNS